MQHPPSQAVSSEVIEAQKSKEQSSKQEEDIFLPTPPTANGNGAHTNGNGNGVHHANGNGNGKHLEPPKVLPSRAASELATAAAAVATVSSVAGTAAYAAVASAVRAATHGTDASSSSHSTNGNGNGKATPTPTIQPSASMQSLDQAMDAGAAGQIETVAATSAAAEAAAANAQPGARRLNKTADGTPYKAPGGRWANFKSYSTLQVCEWDGVQMHN